MRAHRPVWFVTLAIPASFACGVLGGSALSRTGVEDAAFDLALCQSRPSAAKSGPPDLIRAHGFELVDGAADSHAMGLWNPVAPFDTCSREFHDSFFVVGPDGKRYPTWHPPVARDPRTGQLCTFGHEHGRDPRLSQLWKTKQIQRAFYWDANDNGQMDPDEEALAGVPFGWVNEQADLWFQANGIPTMRHEDHVGHKIEWANGEPDLATHNMSPAPNGGVWIGRLGNGVVAHDTGMRCFFLAKAHQGTSTRDAFVHNLHEVNYLADCRHRNDLALCANPNDLSTCPDTHPANTRISVSVLQPFNRAGGFTSFMPLCNVPRRGDPQDFVEVGHSQWSQWYPAGDGDREIPTRACVEIGFLVLPGQWSQNLYEAWPASLSVRRANGTPLVSGINLLFDVQDAARYFYPEALKVQRGYHLWRPELSGTHLGYSMDLCYDRSLEAQGRRYRGGPCDWATNYGQIQGIDWNDPRSGFRGLNRGMYFQPGFVDNLGGPTVWWTDPYGGRASTTPFPGAIRQVLSAKRIDYSTLIGGASIDPRVASRVHADGGGTVHAPN